MSHLYIGMVMTKNSVTMQELIGQLGGDKKIGAFTSFSGILRESSDKTKKKVVKMEVEAWPDKASDTMNQIAVDIGVKYQLMGIRLIHFEGMIELGEPIVLVAISSVHRKEAFAALEEVILRYKQESPVWKKEIYDDGSSNWITTAK